MPTDAVGGAAVGARSSGRRTLARLPILSAQQPLPLYESRRGDDLLLIEPRSGRWWVGAAHREEHGRSEVRRLAELPDAVSYDSTVARRSAMVVVVKNRDCNLACTYCFAAAGTEKTYPTEAYLAGLFERLLRDMPWKKEVVFLFSGGEALLHFDAIRGTIEQFRARVSPEFSQRASFGLMTNATAITREMAEFFREQAVSVCVSVDGPPEWHDRNRPTIGGGPSLETVERKLALLSDTGVPFSVIATVAAPEELLPSFEYLTSRGYRRLFMRPLRLQGRQMEHENGPGAGVEVRRAYERRMAAEFLRLADRIAQHNRTSRRRISEQTLTTHLSHLLTRSNPFMCLSSPCGAACGAMLGVDWHGNLYPCDTMVEFPELRIADSAEVTAADDLQGLFDRSDVLRSLDARRVENISECSTCHVQRYCGGGCSSTSFEVNRDLSSPSDRCHFERALFEGLLWRVFDDPRKVPYYLGGPEPRIPWDA